MKKLLMAAVALSLMTAPCLFSTEANAANTAPATVASGTKAHKASKASKAKAPAKVKKVSAKAPAKAKKAPASNSCCQKGRLNRPFTV
mgnify:CR=1 FL=1